MKFFSVGRANNSGGGCAKRATSAGRNRNKRGSRNPKTTCNAASTGAPKLGPGGSWHKTAGWNAQLAASQKIRRCDAFIRTSEVTATSFWPNGCEHPPLATGRICSSTASSASSVGASERLQLRPINNRTRSCAKDAMFEAKGTEAATSPSSRSSSSPLSAISVSISCRIAFSLWASSCDMSSASSRSDRSSPSTRKLDGEPTWPAGAESQYMTRCWKKCSPSATIGLNPPMPG